jgi:SHS2 domain-containing protein
MNMDKIFVPSKDGVSIGEHTADLWLEFEGGSLEECIQRAVHGLYSVMAQEYSLIKGSEVEEILNMGSAEMLVVDILNEALYLFDAESSLMLDPSFTLHSERKSQLRFRKIECEIPPGKSGMEVKAATFHGMELSEDQGKWKGRILLDI